jgi:uncharacterized protein (TIGR03435 family)
MSPCGGARPAPGRCAEEAQLGIRLQPEKMQTDVIVIDQVEKPTLN